MLGFCGLALALLSILPVYLGASYAFFFFNKFFIIKKKKKDNTAPSENFEG